MKKKILQTILVITCIFCVSVPAFASYTSVDVGLATRNYLNNVNGVSEQPSTTSQNKSNDLKLTIDSVPIQTDTPPVNINGRILVPMRALFEAVNATVQWDDATKTATATKGNTVIKITIGSNIAYVNGVAKALDVPAQTIDGRTMIPSRFIGENLNYNVGWDGANNTVKLTTYQDAYDHLDAAANNVSGVPDGWFKIDGSYNEMIKAIADGYVVYVNGQCWASPDYINMTTNENVVYFNDVSAGNNTPIYNDILKPDTDISEYIELEEQKRKETEEKEQEQLMEVIEEMIKNQSATGTLPQNN